MVFKSKKAAPETAVPGYGSDTAAVDQNQCGARVEATQGDRSRSRRTARAGRIILNRNAVRTCHRLTLEKLFHRGALTRFVDQIAVENKNRVRADLFRGWNEGASHSHGLASHDHPLGFRLLSKCVRCEN